MIKQENFLSKLKSIEDLKTYKPIVIPLDFRYKETKMIGKLSRCDENLFTEFRRDCSTTNNQWWMYYSPIYGTREVQLVGLNIHYYTNLSSLVQKIKGFLANNERFEERMNFILNPTVMKVLFPSKTTSKEMAEQLDAAINDNRLTIYYL